MNVELDPVDRKDIEALARAEGKEVEALLREIVHAGITKRKRNGVIAEVGNDVIRRQREALDEIHAELDALPVEGAEDGFSGRDHDKVLYGGPAPGRKVGFPESHS